MKRIELIKYTLIRKRLLHGYHDHACEILLRIHSLAAPGGIMDRVFAGGVRAANYWDSGLLSIDEAELRLPVTEDGCTAMKSWLLTKSNALPGKEFEYIHERIDAWAKEGGFFAQPPPRLVKEAYVAAAGETADGVFPSRVCLCESIKAAEDVRKRWLDQKLRDVGIYTLAPLKHDYAPITERLKLGKYDELTTITIMLPDGVGPDEETGATE